MVTEAEIARPMRPSQGLTFAVARAYDERARMQSTTIGKLLGRYTIEQRLGQGGMGEVYRARDLRLRRTVAIKILKSHPAVHPAAWGHLLAEARAASSLNHPNICTIYEAGEEEGQAYIAMEYVPGEPLSVAVPPGGLSPELVARYGTQIASALEHAHRQGVIHRDIKTANIMLTPDGLIKVLDFGLAQQLEPEELTKTAVSQTSLKELGAFAGTLPYLAPEILRGKPATARTDIWALGVVLQEMATGKLPFQGETSFELSMAIMMESKVALPPEMPLPLRSIVGRCLEKDPARRYQSAAEVEEDLRNSSVVLASGAAAPAWSGSSSRRLAIPAGVLALLLAMSLAVLLPSSRKWLLHRGQELAPQAHRIPPLSERKVLAVVPFRAVGDPASFKYVAEGLTEALSARLSQISSLQVIPSAEVEQAAGKQSLDKLAGELGVNLAVTGFVQAAGDEVRVVVALQDLADRTQLWTQQFSGSRRQLLAIEDRIFPQLISASGLSLSPEESASVKVMPTGSADAYDLYLRGRDAIRGFENADDISAAVSFYQQALQQDPDFALAWAGMADASLEMYGQKEENFWVEKALHAAQEAVRLGPRLAEAHFALGSVYLATGRAHNAVSQLKRALDFEPNSDEGYRRLGSAYLAARQKDDAISAYQTAIRLSPYYPDNYQVLGDAYLDLGENEKALGAYRRVTELEPDRAAGYEGMGGVYFREGKWAESIPEFQKALDLQPDYITYSDVGLAYFYLKRYEEATRMFEKAVALNPGQEAVVGNLADAYRWSGQKENAVATYDRAIELANQRLQVNPRDSDAMGDLALYYCKKGDSAQATKLIRQARAINPSDVGLVYTEAVVDTLAGQPTQALQSLREAFSRGYSPRQADNDPELSRLRSLPEYARLSGHFDGGSR